ncbi:MAG: hypothetical protein PF518_08595 [Spirochaetaceae bacterium]|jgi:hypothetical protein|nr:hypothetical protein [Spirochaetaceae bacterium]
MKAKTNELIFAEIESILKDLYGNQPGVFRYEYLLHRAENFLKDKEPSGNKRASYADLKGKIFAIAYPDNIYSDKEYTLETLSKALQTHFPSVKGIHVLPERTMSHYDVWPQDFFHLYDVKTSNKILKAHQEENLIDENRIITTFYSQNINTFVNSTLKKITGKKYDSTKELVIKILDQAFNSHFNDGGFSQKTRATVDPRFGRNEHLIEITSLFSTMLDYVVNHLDVDNDYLEEFRKGNNDGEAFLIIYRDQYKQLIADRILEKTFRPRPFPLFTGLRKYPAYSLEGEPYTLNSCAAEMNRIFTANNLKPLDVRLLSFLSIYFKIENDQGLSSKDKRIFWAFEKFTEENLLDTASFWLNSDIQTKQKVFNPLVIDSMETFLSKLHFESKYADLFRNDCDHIFGREFYIYTTFSESQADVNPLLFDGFKMIIDDLFYLLSSGNLSMMRMDAIKYLWKEIGSKNFDMDEGNKLIQVIRLLMAAVSPATRPLDEINSPDPVVYTMAKDGGFVYLFGQVNAVPAAFNMGNLQPLVRFNQTLNELCPENLVRFVMLSTHDGRSVQGLGVQRSDGHVSIEQFYTLKDTVESRGGKAKFRSVPKGEIDGDTFRKVFIEAGFETLMDKLNVLFEEDLIKNSDLYKLKDQNWDESDLLEELSLKLGVDISGLNGSAAIDFFIQWIINGKTDYELCCTTRCAFSKNDCEGNSLTAEEEAQRLALAQLFVLTQGQDVPAIYVNDLLGLENDIKQYGITGKPRDLNRHKNNLQEMEKLLSFDPFTKKYTQLLNAVLKLRAEDLAFYPGNRNFQFIALSDQVFINHPYADNNHSIIIGNIGNQKKRVEVKIDDLKDFNSQLLKDLITGKEYEALKGKFSIEMKPYGFLWLK